MSFVLGPNDSPVNDSKSSLVDGNFGGNRGITSNISKSQDYRKPSGGAPNKIENPKDVSKDVDEMTEAESRKREFSRREETSNTQESNEAGFISKTDSNNRPLEDTDPFEPDSDPPKKRRSKNKYHFGDGQYEGEIS